jgi:anaphase-promoting complex subunit 1
VVKTLIDEGFIDKVLLRDELPAGVVVPLLEVLYRCRSDNESLGLTYEDAAMWSLIGRDDLCKNAQNTENDFAVNGAPRNNPGIPVSSDPSNDQNRQLEDKDKDGVCPLEITSSMLFPDDNRIREVARLLRSSRPTHLNVPRAIEVSDHDYGRLKQEKLLLLSRRILALPVGRGMFTIGNLQPVPAEPLPLPEISLVGRVPPTNAMLALDTSETPADLKVWPEFHNGVAAGLRLPLEADAGEIISKITRTWIVYNRPDESAAQSQNNTNNNSASPPPSPIHAHGGLLMALGLRGHLTTLEMTDIFDYLTQGTVTTTVGVLLGMAVK